MKRILLPLLVVFAVVCLAGSAWAIIRGEGGGGESAQFCLCDEAIGGIVRPLPNGPTCTITLGAAGCGTVCVDNDGCQEDQICIAGTFSGCEADDCGIFGPCISGECDVNSQACTIFPVNTCEDVAPECANGQCFAASDFPNNDIVFCPHNIPTLSQWGLILFGMLLLTTMFIVIRRRGLPTQMTASLLVLMAVGVLATGASYAEIQSNRVCGETDVAVEFVNDILNS